MTFDRATAMDLCQCIISCDASTSAEQLASRLKGATQHWASDDSVVLKWRLLAVGRPAIAATFRFDSFGLLERATATCEAQEKDEAMEGLSQLAHALRRSYDGLGFHRPKQLYGNRTRPASATARWKVANHEHVTTTAQQVAPGSPYWKVSIARSFDQPMARDRSPPSLADLFI